MAMRSCCIAPKKEITALAIDGAGNIYAAGAAKSARIARVGNQRFAGGTAQTATPAGMSW